MVIRSIATVTFIESLRNRTLYILLLFSVVYIILGRTLGYVAPTTDREKMLLVAGLTGMTVFGFIIALFTGMSLVQKEMNERTIYTILSKPVNRHQFIVGKYIGLMLLFLLIVSLMLAILLVFHLISGGEIVIELFYYAFLLVMELSVVTAAAIFFSLLTSPIFSAVATFCLFVAGNAMETIFDRVLYLHHENWLGRYLIIGIHMVIPNFYNFNISNEIINHYSVPFVRVALAAVYGLLFSAVFLYISILIFEKKRLK